MKDWKPAGYTSVAPYLVVSDATATIKFLVDALDGTQLRTVLRPDGTIMHAEVRIDDTVVMLAQGNDQWPPAPSSVHIYVRDVDASYARALAAGATSIMPPARQDDPDKRGGVKDAGGTSWWLATQVV